MPSVSKYQEIVQYIKEKVENGAYAPDEHLPTEQSLAEQFHTSRPTVAKAMNRLKDMGIVSRIQGSGTFVNQSYLSVASQGTNIISVVLPFAQYRDVARLDEMNILKGIEKCLSQQGFFTMIRYCKDNGEDFIETIKAVKNTMSVGIIAYVAKDLMQRNEIYDLFTGEYPIVLIDQPIIGIDLPCVRSDNVKGGAMAARYLVDCGYKTIYFLSDVNMPFNESIRERYIGYCQVVQSCKSQASFNHVLLTSQEEDDAPITELVQHILNKHAGERVGLFCTGDLFASRIYRICLSFGCRIPDQIGIVGFDGLGVSLSDSRILTTVAQNFYNIGKLAASTMLKRLANPSLPLDDIKADVQLIEGDSAAPLIIKD